jgi:phage tail sheath protein FI
MPVIQQGAVNTTALIVPNVYVQIVPPQVKLLNGIPTNIVGVVGSAAWGPVNAPAIIGSMEQFAQLFGPIQARKFDLGTAVAAAVLQGANNFRCVRVTDGSDLAATFTMQTNCLTVSSRYTGSLGNTIQVQLSAGRNSTPSSPTYKVTVLMPGRVSEVFDNIGGSGNALWINIANAINLGQSGLRGPSEMVIATAGAGTAAPTLTTYTLGGGTDGAASVSAITLLGSDTTPRTGMYGLRGTGASIGMLADCDDSTAWSAQAAFGLSEGIYMIMTGPAGDTISNAVSAKAAAGIDSYAAKLLFGDWCYFKDTVNGQQRLISPQGYIAGLLANLAPNQSSLNKQLFGIVGTQRSANSLTYSDAELGALGAAGIDVIANPSPGGNYFGARFGHNSSSDPVVNGDNYTRMTNYLAYTLNGGMGRFIGLLQSKDTRRQAKSTIESFLNALWQQGLIGQANGSVPFSVVLDDSNNPASRVALGYMQCDVQVVYLSIIEKFVINVEGGQSVQVNRLTTAPNQ